MLTKLNIFINIININNLKHIKQKLFLKTI